VTVFEAAPKAGGQVRLTATSERRREMIGIIDWRQARCEEQGVHFRFNTLADAQAVRAESPDVVIIATGGLPHTEVLSAGNELVVSAWDILSGDVKPARDVLLYDDAGDHPALQAAERIAQSGARVEIMTPDRTFAPEVMAMNLVPYMRSLQKLATTFTVTWRLESVQRDGDTLLATVGSDYGGARQQRRVDQVVVNHGTRPLDELYFELKPHSANGGAVDYAALIEGRAQPAGGTAAIQIAAGAADAARMAGGFLLYRIGDAVSARNTHAAIYDALRLVKDL
jgi:N-methyl-L-proline demethylase